MRNTPIQEDRKLLQGVRPVTPPGEPPHSVGEAPSAAFARAAEPDSASPQTAVAALPLRRRAIVGIFVLAIVGSIGVLCGLFMLQATVVIGHFRPIYLVMPSFAGVLVGSLIAIILLMRARMRRSAAAYRMLVDMAPVFTMQCAADGSVRYISRACQVITGYPASAFYDDPTLLGRLVVKADQDAWQAANQAVHDGPVSLDLRLCRPSGQTVWVSYQAAPVRGRGGRFDGIRSSTIDITKRKRAETALQESEQRLPAIAEGSPVPLVISRWSDGLVLYANPQAEATLGIAPTQMVGRRMSDVLWDPNDRTELRTRLASDDYVSNWPLDLRCEDGTRLATVHSLRMITYEGAPALLGSFIDVSEQRRARAALEESEQRFRAIAESLPMSLMITRRADGRILYANPHSELLVGLAPDESVGRNIAEFYWNPAERETRLGVVDQEGFLSSVPMDARRTDGTKVSGVVSIRGILYDGEPALLTCFSDLTEQRALEEQLRQAQKMQAVGELTGGIAHDFNNLLGAIMGSAELIQAGLAKDQETHDRLIDAILRASDHGAALTRQLLAFSRRQTLAPETIRLNELIDNMADLLRRTLGASIEIETVHPPDLWPCIADPAQLENAILNLAINARDAMPDGGRLIVETSNAIFDNDFMVGEPEVGPGEYATVTVTDTGVGMSPDLVERAFEPFFTTKGVGEGTGLGLSMVYGFAKQSGGQATIYSEPGIGTSVRIFLPRAVAETGEPECTQPADHPAGAGECILIVENDMDVRVAAATMLDSLGYRVLQAGDGGEALAMLAGEPDIVLLLSDVVLPGGMNGPEIARRARQQRPDLKVLYMSGYPDRAAQGQGCVVTDAPMLQKPFRRGDLAVRIREVLTDGGGGALC